MVLNDLLNDEEKRKVASQKLIDESCLFFEIKDLQLYVFSKIAFVLIETEYKGEVPSCVLAAEAINILVKRAKSKNLSIFQ